MKSVKLTLVLVVILSSITSLYAQLGTIKGKVTDAKTNEELIGVNIIVDGTSFGSTTDFEGNYTLKVEPGSYKLIFRYLGYEDVIHNITIVMNQVRTLNTTLGESAMLLDQVVVSASRFERKLGEETVSMEVIKPAAIENLGITSADGAVERSPGVTIVEGQINIRGGAGWSYGAGSRVLLLQDDLPLTQMDAGRPIFSNFPVENIGQIEIIKGAASALYGSSALNGIVNIRTAFPKSEPQTKVSFFTTQYQAPRPTVDNDGNITVTSDEKKFWRNPEIIVGTDTFDNSKGTRPHSTGFSLSHRQKFNNLDVVIGAYAETSQEWRHLSFNHRARLNTILRYRFKKKEGMSVGLNATVSGGYNSSFFLWNGVGADLYTHTGLAGLPTETKALNVQISPNFQYVDDKGNSHKILSRYIKVDFYNTNNQNNFSNNYYLEYQYQKRFEDIDLAISGGVVGNYTSSFALLYGGEELSARNFSGYLQLDKKFFGKLNVSAGFRVESNKITLSEPETKPVARIGLNYQAAQYTFIRGSFGQGYRFPSIAEKFVSTLVGVLEIGRNLDLVSETGMSAEVGVKQGIKLGRNLNAMIDISGFFNQYNNMMEFGPVRPSDPDVIVAFRSNNVGDTRIWGTEITLAGEGKLGKFPATLLLGYNYIIPKFINWDSNIPEEVINKPDFEANRDLTPGQLNAYNSSSKYNVLKYRFRHTFTADFGIKFDRLEVGAAARYFSFMENVDILFEDILPGIREFRDSKLKNPNIDPDKIGPGSHKGDFILDARIGYHFGAKEQGKISLICKNILNKEYALRPGLIEAPLSYTVRLDFTF